MAQPPVPTPPPGAAKTPAPPDKSPLWHLFLHRARGAALAVLVCTTGLWWWFTGHSEAVSAMLAQLPSQERMAAWLRQPDLATLPGLPRHWNPWAPLTLEEADGPLTRWKLGRLEAAPAACLQWLAGAPAIASTPLPDRNAGTAGTADGTDHRCGWEAASRISSMGEARFSSPFTLGCGAAVALARWERHVVQPAARAQLGSPVVRIEHLGSYACRRIAGSAGPGRLSEHARANALDVAAFTLADGRRVSVLADWYGEAAPPSQVSGAGEGAGSHLQEGDAAGEAGRAAAIGARKAEPPAASVANPKAVFLRQVRDGACRSFAAVLGPDYNAAHRNHFHLDQGRYRACR